MNLIQREEIESFYKYEYAQRERKTLNEINEDLSVESLRELVAQYRNEKDFQILRELVLLYKRNGVNAVLSYWDFIAAQYPQGLDWFLTVAVKYGNKEMLEQLILCQLEIGRENCVEKDASVENE